MRRSDLFDRGNWLVAFAIALTALLYWPGLSGGWFFDDAPNIVDNLEVQPREIGLATLLNAAFSSPASELKRPLASLSFAANYIATGLEPFGWKLTNLLLHLANGWLVYVLSKLLLHAAAIWKPVPHAELTAALVASGWLLLPINLTAVLYIVQRMESLANLFVLIGLIGYLRGRLRMQRGVRGLGLCLASLASMTLMGVLAKETAIMLPLYACLIEALLFGFRSGTGRDSRIVTLHVLLLAVPGFAGLAILTPWLLDPSTWATRDFTLYTRLLSEARIIVGYVGWIVLPLPQWLSFYHDDFAVSHGLASPWTTLVGIGSILLLLALAWSVRVRQPLVALGISLFLGSHLLTGTVLPLELIFEHRNYFASFALLLAFLPLLTHPSLPLALPRHALVALLLTWWATLTGVTAIAWREPLQLATELAIRAPDSPRARYAYAEALLYQSDYDPDSALYAQAWHELEIAAAMPESSIQPEQTMILASALLGLPLMDGWWDSMAVKLRRRTPNSEDIGALGGLVRCAVDGRCQLPLDRMNSLLSAAEEHERRDAKLLSIHSDWAWAILRDRPLGIRLAEEAVLAQPSAIESRVALARMQVVMGNTDEALAQLHVLEQRNFAGRLDREILDLRQAISRHRSVDYPTKR